MESSRIPMWLAYAVFGVFNLAALVGLLVTIGPLGWAWLVVCGVSVCATVDYTRYRATAQLHPSADRRPAIEVEPPTGTGKHPAR